MDKIITPRLLPHNPPRNTLATLSLDPAMHVKIVSNALINHIAKGVKNAKRLPARRNLLSKRNTWIPLTH